MRRYKILLVDDDPQFVNSMTSSLVNDFQIVGETSAYKALSMVQASEFDAVTIDILMPGLDGYKFFKMVRAARPELLCVFLTQLLDDTSFMKAMELGPEDFITKPVTPLRLACALRNRIRKLAQESVAIYRNLKMDLVSGVCRVDECRLDLTKTEWQILLQLVRNQSRKLSRKEIFTGIWGDRRVSQHTLDTHVANLRRKLRGYGIRVAFGSNCYYLTAQ